MPNIIEREPNKLTITDVNEFINVSLIAERNNKGEVSFYIDEVGESLSYAVELDKEGKQALINFLQEK